MPRNHRPRKRYVPKRMDWDPVSTAIARATLLMDQQRTELSAPLAAAMAAMKAGRGTMQHWCDMADALNVSERLCELGLCSDRTQAVQQGQAALAELHQRHAQRGAWTLRAAEIRALEGPGHADTDELGALQVHAIQLQHATQGEVAEAIARAANGVRQALAGNAPTNACICVGAIHTINAA